MEADAHYLIGSAHAVCQDYALAGRAGERWVAIVCDGCSSSSDTDVGARVLARAFLAAIAGQTSVSAALDQALSVAHEIISDLALPSDALDATLCGWVVADGMAEGFIHGDGVLSVRTSAGLEIHQATQADNAPHYPGYRCDLNRCRAHRRKYGSDTLVTVLGLIPRTFTVQGDYRVTIAMADVAGLAAFSDGAATVSHGAETLTTMAVADVLTRFPQANGNFLSRRIRRQTRDWGKAGFAPTDDLAGAALVP